MALILCIETATEVCSVAVSINGKCIIEERLEESRGHSSMLTSMIQACLKTSNVNFIDLSAVAISDGPGSYTGLRVGASTAKGICFARNIPLIAISSLKALAFPHMESQSTEIVSTIDARRMESYIAHWGKDLIEISPAYCLIWEQSRVDQIFRTEKPTIICGTGIEKAMNTIRFPSHVIVQPSLCSARNLCHLAEDNYNRNGFVNTASYAPSYLKSPNITLPSSKLQFD